MAPQATLTFTPSTPSTSEEKFSFDSFGSFNNLSLWPFSDSRPSESVSSHPVPFEPSRTAPPLPPTVSVTGPFSLLRGGAVQVGQLRVGIERGTFVGRCTGLGESGRASRGLWWMGIGTRGEPGIWTLQLLLATDADAVAVHRLLLYLPPLANPTTSPPPLPQAPAHQPPPPSYRNSLVIYDHHTQQVVSVVPVESSAARGPRRPLPPLPTSKPLPPLASPPAPASPGAKLAQYVDRVVQGIHPDPTPDSLSAAERLEQGRISRQASREERDWDPFLFDQVFFARPVSSSTRESTEDVNEKEEEDQSVSKAHSRDTSSSTLQTAHVDTHPSVAPSEISLSSYATFGTERFVTADEFDEEEAESSKRSSFASIVTTGSRFFDQFAVKDVEDQEEDQDATPTPSTFAESQPVNGTSAPDQSSLASFDPSHTLTNGNAVLLSFLGAPSVVSSVSPHSISPRVRVSAHPLSGEQVTEQVESGTIKAAEVEWNPEEGEKGWFDWLTSLLKSLDIEGTESKGWLAWIPWPWNSDQAVASSSTDSSPTTSNRDILSSSTFTTSTASSPSLSPTLCLSPSSNSSRAPARRHGRASGETASRISVIYVDGEGRGSRAFVANGI